MVEITVIVKGEDKTLRKKFLVYEKFTLHQEDPLLNQVVEETVKEVTGEIDSVRVKISMQW